MDSDNGRNFDIEQNKNYSLPENSSNLDPKDNKDNDGSSVKNLQASSRMEFFNHIDIITPLGVSMVLIAVVTISKWFHLEVCTTKIDVSGNIRVVELACLFAFASNTLSIIMRILDIVNDDGVAESKSLKIYFAAIIVNLIAGSSIAIHWLTSADHDNICLDEFGVPYYTTFFVEWFSVTPFLIYISAIVNGSTTLMKRDKISMLSSAFTVFFGFCLAISKSLNMAYIFYGLTIISLIFCLRNLLVSTQLLPTGDENFFGTEAMEQIQLAKFQSDKRRGIFLSISFSLFGIIHLLTWLHLIPSDLALQTMMACNTFIKINLCEMIIHSQSSLSNKITKIRTVSVLKMVKDQDNRQQAEINLLNEFRNMLGNVTHDLKTPLAGFNGAIDLIEDDMKESSSVLMEFIAQYQKNENFDRLTSILKNFTSVQDYIDDFAASPVQDSYCKDNCNQPEGMFSKKMEHKKVYPGNIDSCKISNDAGLSLAENGVSSKSPYRNTKTTRSRRLNSILISMIPRDDNNKKSKVAPSIQSSKYEDVNFSSDDLSRSSSFCTVHSNSGNQDDVCDISMVTGGADIQKSVTSFQTDASHLVKLSNASSTTTKIFDVTLLHENKSKKCLNILLVDDSEMIVKVVSKKLTRAGHCVDVAENGADAVIKFKEMEEFAENDVNHKKYDIILMDCFMPVMDGIEATTRIRDYERQNETKRHQIIIGCSANISMNERVNALYPDMDYLLLKPFDMIGFENAIEELQII
eukprot:gene6932-9485_t